MTSRFPNRSEAGKQLAACLKWYSRRKDVIVLALPRGGVPVGFEVAKAIHVPLNVFVVRKLGVPGQEELAMGALASGGVVVLNREIVDSLQIPDEVINAAVKEAQQEVDRRQKTYCDDRPSPELRDKTILLVDDGLATGATMRAAVEALKKTGVKHIVIAVPVAPPSVCKQFEREGNEVVCLETPDYFRAVGQWYDQFTQTTDQEVHDLLLKAAEQHSSGDETMIHGNEISVQSRHVTIPIGQISLEGDLCIPDDARGIVLFAHGSGSSRHSPRNRMVASHLQAGGLATLLMDLLTRTEEQEDLESGQFRFDINLLAIRLTGAADWLARSPETRNLPIGVFGASTGGGAALAAAADSPHRIAAVVSRGGRPDLAGEALARVQAPTLLIVGGEDRLVIELNRLAMEKLTAKKRMEIIPGATHLFEESGTLEQVADLARDWFQQYLSENPNK